MIQLSSDSCRESLFQEDWSQIDDVEGMEVHKDKKEETKEIPKRLHYCFQPSYAFFSLGPWNLCLLKTLEQFPLLVCFCLGLLFLFERGTHSSIFIQLPKNRDFRMESECHRLFSTASKTNPYLLSSVIALVHMCILEILHDIFLSNLPFKLLTIEVLGFIVI